MTAIAWAIVVAGIYIAPPRDKTDKNFEANNLFDVLFLVFALGMLIYHG